MQHYLTFVKPAYEEFCMPTKKVADVIIPRGADNKIGIELIRQEDATMIVGLEPVPGMVQLIKH